MRHSFAWKAVALILCACARTAAVAGGFGVTMMAGSSMYSQTLEEKQEQLPIQNGQVQLRFRPFEIKTLLVEQ